MNKTAIFAIVLGLVLVGCGAAYYLGYFDNLTDYIPWFADKGDLKVYCYDGNGTADKSDDVALANVTISILGTELQQKTNANGTVLFNNVEVGDYTVVAEYNSTLLYEDITIQKEDIAIVDFIFNGTAS